MAAHSSKQTHKWTAEETRRLIRFRSENEHLFLKSKYGAKKLWETFIKDLGLEGMVTGQQASKKWENLKKKYKDLRTPKTGSGTDAGQDIVEPSTATATSTIETSPLPSTSGASTASPTAIASPSTPSPRKRK